MDKVKIITFQHGEITEYFIKTKDGFIPLTERIMSKHIYCFSDLSEKAQKREWKKWLDTDAEIICEAEIDSRLPNSYRKLRLGNQKKIRPTQDDLAKGATSLLAIPHLWSNQAAGYYIISTLIAGYHARALRQQIPSLCLEISIRSDNKEMENILRQIIYAAVPRKRWSGKNCSAHRDSILKYSAFDTDPLAPPKLLNFSRIKIQGVKKFRIPCAYEDTAALIIGARSSQMRKAEPYFQNAAAILLNCEKGEQRPLQLTAKDLFAYDPELLAQIAQDAQYIAAILSWWWERYTGKEASAWAQEMASRAQKAFRLADNRFVRLEADPKKLRLQLLYQVFLDFIDQLELHGLLPIKQADCFREEAMAVFAPESSISKPTAIPLQANAPDIFLAIMRKLAADHSDSIVPEGQECVKHKNFFGAWRTISDVRYLVMEEDAWAQWFSKEVKHMKEVVSPKLDSGNQRSAFLRPLGESALIKKSGDNPRYRYDLFKNGTREKTYVVAIPADSLQAPAA